MTVQLECKVDGAWIPAKRYDTSHGSELHVHTAPWDKAIDRKVPVPHGGLNHAMNQAITDLVDGYERYREVAEIGHRGAKQ